MRLGSLWRHLSLLLLFGCEPEVREVHEPLPPQATPTPVPVPLHQSGAEAPSAGLRMRARHLLVAYEGALGSRALRSREEALALAKDRWRQVAAGANLETLAISGSDDVTARRGGMLGTFSPGTFAGPIESAVAATPVGELTPLVETPWGFHVVRRLALDEVNVQHLTFGWRGALRSSATRSRDAALQEATRAMEALRAGTPAWQIASDARSPRQGDRVGRRQWSAPLENAAFSLAVGEVSQPIESATGFVVIQRVE